MAGEIGGRVGRIHDLLPFVLAALVTLMAGVVLLRMDGYRREQTAQMERDQVRPQLDLVRARLEDELAGSLLLSRSVVAHIVSHGDIEPEDFSREAKVLVEGHRNVIDLVVSRGTEIAMVYPLAGNAEVLGRDYHEYPLQWPSVELAIRTQKPNLNGPVRLIQGGTGLIVRDPVFLADPHGNQDKFFGVVSVVLDIPTIFADAGLNSPNLPIRVAVRNHAGGADADGSIYGDEAMFHRNPVEMDVALPYGTWRIAAEPKGGWSTLEPWYAMPRLTVRILFLLVVVTAFGTAVFVRQREETGRKLALSKQRLAQEAERFHTLLQHASDGIHILDAQGNLIEASDSFCQMLGYSREEAIGMNVDLWDAKLSSSEVAQNFSRILAQDEVQRLETLHRRKDGSVFEVEVTCCRLQMNGQQIVFNSARDITERRISERKIHQLAFFDQLTGIPNRIFVLERLRSAMATGARHGVYGSLLYIDLDDFKILNDTLGHPMGDLLLKQVAERLNASVRVEDTVARLGGDEFLILAPYLGEDAEKAAIEAEAMAERVMAALNTVYQLDQCSYHCTPSIGVILFRGQEVSADDLLKQADLAMYKAKASGRNTIRYFDPGMETAVRKRAALEGDLRAALDEGQFQLFFQAQVTGDGRPTGAECLVRWQHPQRGLVLPGEFIPLAEETGLILPLGQWVLETACKQLATWAARPGMGAFKLAVNVSSRQFRQPTFVRDVMSAIESAGADPAQLNLELTESLLVENVQDTVDKMLALKAQGVRFSLDDFGTGYSSLSYLQRLPLDQMKIDRSFVRDALSNRNNAALARTVVALAQNLGIDVVAEGIETAEQRDFLIEAGCFAFQGFFFCRPMALGGFEKYLDTARAIEPDLPA
jgi:diguanylate cyclase (GGDEF)-like protein/PAS domain S-box-containing protein